MRGHHDVHVIQGRGLWWVVQGRRRLSKHFLQSTAMQGARSIARRDHVELVVHGRNGRIRSKGSYGREGTMADTEQ